MRAFRFGDVCSRDFGVGISGTGTYNAPERDVEVIDIPGRNGSIVQDNGRFRNIEIAYPAFIRNGFDELFPKFKSAMKKNIGYLKLTDEYDVEHYRMAEFHDALVTETGVYNRSGRFDVVFNCKPQRYLVDGAKTVTYMPLEETNSGISVAGIAVTPGTEFSVRGHFLSGTSGSVAVTYYTSGSSSVRADTTALSGNAVSYSGTVPASAATATVVFPPQVVDYITINNAGVRMRYNDTGIVLVNPTPYDAQPVMSFYGASESTLSLITAGDPVTYDIELDAITTPCVTVDSVIGDCYFDGYVSQIYVFQNLNPYVTLKKDSALAYDYPVVKGGGMMVIPTVAFDKAEITPGWWEV